MPNFKLTSRLTLYWYLILVLRIILVLVPQTGYIHPDEFFQSVEVLAGKVFDVECNPPWEFNSTLPIRSMTIPYFTIGMSYEFLNSLNNLSNQFLGKAILTPYLLLVTPRLLVCIFSFIIDYTLYKICSNNNEKYTSRLIILGSSYVMLVYGTRTFSNVFELILFSILLYFVCKSLTFSNILIRKREYLNYHYEQSRTVAKKTKFHKLQLFISDSFRNCFVISTVTVLGFFNRPTFIAFAVTPICFWLCRGIGTKSVTVLQFNSRMLLFALCSIPSFVTCILVDSFYYGYITWGEVGKLDVSINSFVFTPLNFFKYNLNSDNLVVHGLHPWFLHALVNVPLLFNVLGICAVFSLLRYMFICLRHKPQLLPSVRSVRCLMTLCFVIPVALLSLIPHQEPRYIMPVVLPLAYLHGMTILPEPDTVLVKAPKIQLRDNRAKTPTQSYFVLKIWLVANAVLTIFYGFLHQGGVYQATSYIARELEQTSLTTEFHIVTSHIYSLPQSFFMQKLSDKLYRKKNIQYYVSRRVFLYEEGSKDMNHVFDKLQDIINVIDKRYSQSKAKKFKVYLVIASSLDDRLHYSKRRQFFTLNLLETFFPHVSTEAFPDLTGYCVDVTEVFYEQNCTKLSYDQYFTKVLNAFGLSLYEVLLNDK